MSKTAFPEGRLSVGSVAIPHSSGSGSCSMPCNLCGGTTTKTLATKGRDNKPLRTVICPNCGLVWSDPLPHNPREFYEKEYRLHYKGTYKPKIKHVLRAGKTAIARYNAIRTALPKHGTVLDVGSGGGEFLYLLKKVGHQVKGIEPNIGYAEYSISEYGLDVQTGFIQDAPLEREAFDAITIWHVLEHTDNPSQVSNILYESLKPGGVIIVEVPNVEAVCQSPTSTFHEAHIFNFNEATLQKMLEKSGFSLTSISISEDGGNLTLIAKKPLERVGNSAMEISQPENADRIIRTVEGHNTAGYWVSRHPYFRLAKRLKRIAKEKYDTVGCADGKALLDRLFTRIV